MNPFLETSGRADVDTKWGPIISVPTPFTVLLRDERSRRTVSFPLEIRGGLGLGELLLPRLS